MKTLPSNPTLAGMYEIEHDVVYVTRECGPLTMDVILPWAVAETKQQPSLPAVLFVQGSAWTRPNRYFELPQLSVLARRGYVVATVDHRSGLDGHPFPAFLEDVKSALRFLRAESARFGIDPTRIGLWGTSSGGNSVLLTSLTANGDYRTRDHHEVDESVACVVDCFGPTDVVEYLEYDFNPFPPELEGVLGDPAKPEARKRAQAMSPVELVKAGEHLPPYLILHGTADTVVPYDQSLRLAERLQDCGYDAELIAISGADHEGAFWSQAVLDEMYAFLDRHLKD